MKRLLLPLIILAATLAGCHSVEKWDNDPVGNFDAVWTTIDRHYCFLDSKKIDWDSIYNVYRPKISNESSPVELFNVCSDMLDELRDGHVNLSGWYSTSYYKKWWSDYPQNYNERLVDEHYLHFNALQRNGIKYYILRDSVAYIRYASFSVPPGESTLDWALAILAKCPALIVDIRDNGGGNMTYVESLASRFLSEHTLAGYIVHKTGPGHSDFSKPYAYYYDPPAGHILWQKPVVVLTNRSTFSAANNFASIMNLLPQAVLVGDRTGGGSGMPRSYEIPIGWGLRFSSSPVYDAQMRCTEDGIDPEIHIDLDPEKALDGIDTMLEKAIDVALERAGLQPGWCAPVGTK